MRTRLVATLIATMAILGFTATNAFAFYTSGGCSTTVGTMNVTNYSKGSGQEYHIAARVTDTQNYNLIKIYLAGSLARTAYGTAEVFVVKSNPTANYTATAQFYSRDPDGGYRSCSYVS